MKTAGKTIRIFFLVLLCAVTALFLIGCGDGEAKSEQPDSAANADSAENTGKEEGTVTITVEVINSAGEHKEHTIVTKGKTLADALLESGLAEGPIEEYGLFITTVDGEVADWAVDQSYWALSKDGEYLMTGASDTPIADGEHYELTYTK